MKTAVSIPDPVFRNAEQLAKKMKVSRSRLYSVAVADFVKRYRAADVTDQLNAVYRDSASSLDETVAARTLVNAPRRDLVGVPAGTRRIGARIPPAGRYRSGQQF